MIKYGQRIVAQARFFVRILCEKDFLKMNMFEKARSIREMMKLESMTQPKLATILGVSQPYIANKMRLLDFSEESERKIVSYGLSERHARTILRLKDEALRNDAIEKTHLMNMTVERCEILVDTMLDRSLSTTLKGENSAERIGYFERSLESSVSLLRRSGILARVKREEENEKIRFLITIE